MNKQNLLSMNLLAEFAETQEFNKIMAEYVAHALGITRKAECKVFNYILSNTENNIFSGTYNQIVAEAHTSRRTIASVMKKMQAVHCIEKLGRKAYKLKPIEFIAQKC